MSSREGKQSIRPRHFVIIVYYYSSENVIGSRRWREMSELLTEHGVVTVVCADGEPKTKANSIQVLRVPDEFSGKPDLKQFGERPSNNPIIRALKHYGQSVLFWPDRQRRWARAAVARLESVLTSGSSNFVITSGPRFSVHTAMREWLEMKKPFVQWIMDLRDPWTNDPSPAMRRRSPDFLTRIEARMERSCHHAAYLVTTVSHVMTMMMKRDFKSPAMTLYNGYAESESAQIADVSSLERYSRSICYLGSIIHNLRTPQLLFSAARHLKLDLSQIRFEFWSNDPKLIYSEADRAGVRSLVTCHGFVPLKESRSIQLAAGANLILNGTDSSSDHMITGKAFDHLAARRPVIAITSASSELRSILETCNCDGIVWDEQSALDVIKRFVEGTLREVRDESRRYSRKAAVEALIGALVGRKELLERQ